MHDLQTIIDLNLRAHARAFVAAEQRGNLALAADIECALPQNADLKLFLEEVRVAAIERQNTRGL